MSAFAQILPKKTKMSDRTYTTEQATIVETVLKHGDNYYKILGVEKTCSDSEIKKAYRKLSLKVHPDKNSHPKASESFKKVARAFEVLGDPTKRSIFDQTGMDPDSRGAAASSGFSRASSAGGAASHPFFQQGGFAQGGMPQGFAFSDGDDLFDILFGQGAARGGAGPTFMFGGPGGFTFSSGGGARGGFPFGDPFAQARQSNARRQQQQQQQRQRQAEPDTLWSSLRQYLPMILMLLIPMLSNIFADPVENFNMYPTSTYSHQRTTPRFGVTYYITPKQAESLADTKLKKLDREAENLFVGDLRDKCQRERELKERKINQAYGWVFPDNEKLEEARKMRLESCEALSRIGVGLL